MHIRLRIAILLSASFVIAGAVVLVVGAATYQRPVYESPAEQTDRLLQEMGVSKPVAIAYIRAHPESVVVPDQKPDNQWQGKVNATINAAFQEVQRQAIDAALHRTRRWTAVSLGLMALGAALAGWFIAGRALRPVRMVTARAREASGSDLSGRVALDGPRDEIRELGDTFDQMLDRLERAFLAQRRFSSQVSHEIRTPLSIISSETDLLLRDAQPTERESLEQIRAAVDRAERIVGALLVLARSGSGDLASSELRLDLLAGDVLGDVVHTSAWHTVRAELDLSAAPMRGDQGLVERLVANLLSNAVRHNRAHDGWVEVRTRVEGDWSVLEIANSVPERSDEAPNGRVPGNGVGLTVVDSVVAAHGGELRWDRDQPGMVTVTVRFPVASEALALAGS
jgi:signal transduction histidine kinase